MAAGECFSREAMHAILDAADPQGEQRLARHLESCEACRKALERLAGDEPFAAASLRILAAPPAEDGPALSRIVALSERPIDQLETRYGSVPRVEAAPLKLEASDEPDSIGRLGRFEVLRQLGKGGMGLVYLARDPMLGRQVAIKVLNQQFIGDKSAQERFRREARAAAAINHQNLVTIYSVEEAGDANLLLVMEYVDGESLQERLREQGKIALPELLRLAIQVSLGLAAAHAQGLVHRDVKPGNILLAKATNLAKITDFGLAQAIDDPEANSAGLILGTPAYMSPEQAKAHEVDKRSDLFSLGSVLFAMHTGRPPCEGATMEVIRRVANGPPPALSEIDPSAPEWLVELISHMHAFHVEDRLTSATDVARILKAQLDALKHGSGAGTTPAPSAPPVAPGQSGLRLMGMKSGETIRAPEQTVMAPPPPQYTPVRLKINPSGPATLVPASLAPPLPPRAITTVLAAHDSPTPTSAFLPSSVTPAQPVLAPPVIPPPLPEPRDDFQRMDDFTLRPAARPRAAARRRAKQSAIVVRMVGVILALMALAAVAIGLKQNAANPKGQTPLVVLAPDGTVRGNCADLNAAIETAHAGDTLEIHGNERLTAAPIRIRGKPLTIRAAAQSHPQLIVAPVAATAWLETDAPLTLEGLDVVNRRPAEGVAAGSLFDLHGGSFRAGCCRFVHEGEGPLLNADGAPSVDLQHCLVVDRGGACLEATAKKQGQACQVTADGSIFAGKAFLVLHQNVGVPLVANVRLRHNTIVVHEGIRLHGAPDKNKFDWQFIAHIDSHFNLFDVDQATLLLEFDGLKGDDAQRIARVSRGEADAVILPVMRKVWSNRLVAVLNNLKRTVLWQSDNDMRSGAAPLMALVSAEAPAAMNILGAPATWNDWAQLWAKPSSTISHVAGLIDGASLRKRVDADAASLQPADFRRAKPLPAGVKAANGGNEGAVCDLVGPAAAYEFWKTTPEYDRWSGKEKKP